VAPEQQQSGELRFGLDKGSDHGKARAIEIDS
jgi:hypothetical protein